MFEVLDIGLVPERRIRLNAVLSPKLTYSGAVVLPSLQFAAFQMRAGTPTARSASTQPLLRLFSIYRVKRHGRRLHHVRFDLAATLFPVD